MTDHHPIQTAAIALADVYNPLVVAVTFREHQNKPPCTQCHYVENAHLFHDRIHRYTVWNIRYKKLQRRIFCYHDTKSLLTWGGYENIYANLISADDQLKAIWPCEDCLVRYNPTNRTRRLRRGRRKHRQ